MNIQNNRKKVVIILSAFILLSLFVGSAYAYTGTGTESDPYIIENAEDLSILDTYPSAYFELGADIECAGASYGNYAYTNGFSGHLDGKEHSINLDVGNTNGLFSYLNGAEIKNLTFYACTFNGTNGGALAGYVTGSNQTIIDNVSVIACEITCSGTGSGYYKGAFVGAVNGGNVKFNNCHVSHSLINSSSTWSLASFRTAVAGGFIGVVSGNNSNIEISESYVFDSKISGFTTCSGLIGSLTDSNLSGLNIHDNVLDTVYIVGGWNSDNNMKCYAGGILYFDEASSNSPLDIYFSKNTIYNSLIEGQRGAGGFTFQQSSGNLRPHYSENLINSCTIYQTATGNFTEMINYYAGGFHGSGSHGNYNGYYDGNQIQYTVVYSAKPNGYIWGQNVKGITNLFSPSSTIYSSYTNNKAFYVDLGSAGEVDMRELPSHTGGNVWGEINDYTNLLHLKDIVVDTDSENMRAKTFNAVQIGASLINEGGDYLEGFGVQSEYNWDYTGDGITDETTNVPYVSYIYPSNGDYHPILKANLLSYVNGSVSTYVSTEFMGAPKFVEGANILKDKDIQTYGQNVKLTANMVTGFGAETYEFFYSLDNGTTWNSYAEESSENIKNVTYTSSENTKFVKYRVVATNGYGSTTSEAVSVFWTQSSSITETVTEEFITTENDTYNVKYSVTFPFDTIKTNSLSSHYTVVVTTNGIYLLDNTAESSSQVIKGKLYVLDAYILGCDIYDKSIVYRTDNNKAYYVYVNDDGGFSQPEELIEAEGTLSQISLGTNSVLVRGVSENQEYVLVQFLGESESAFVIYPDTPYKYTNWTLALSSNDNSGTPAVFCSYNNGDKRIIRCYTGADTYFDTPEFTANAITSIKPFLAANKIVLTTNGGRTYIVPYNLTRSSFSWGNVINGDNVILTDVSTTYFDIRYVGINSPSNVVFVSSSSGQVEYVYPVSSTLTSVSISGISGLYAVSGDYDGRVNIMRNSNGSWEGLQNFSIGLHITDTSMSEDYYSLSALTQNKVYLAYYQKYTPPSGDTVLVTKTFVKVIVYDSNGAPLVNTPVSVIGADSANTLTTGYDGSATFEVTAGKQYTIQTNGQTQTFVADNMALKIISIYLKGENYYEDLKFNSEDNNGVISVSFTGNGKEDYDMVFKVYDDHNQGLVNETYEGQSHTFTVTKSQFSVNKYVCTITVTGKKSGITVSRTYTYDSISRSEKGYVILGKIPILPDVMDSNWVKVLFGGLLMIIGGLFSARHSAKGSLIVVIVAAFLTFAGILPLNPVWIGCLVVLAVMALYSFASSQET